MIGYVYVLQSKKNGHFYIGSCGNVERRLIEHNQGLNKSTKNFIPWELKLSQRYEDIKTARQIEFKIKKLKSRKIIERIIEEQIIHLGS
jgi:putative endonuclease